MPPLPTQIAEAPNHQKTGQVVEPEPELVVAGPSATDWFLTHWPYFAFAALIIAGVACFGLRFNAQPLYSVSAAVTIPSGAMAEMFGTSSSKNLPTHWLVGSEKCPHTEYTVDPNNPFLIHVHGYAYSPDAAVDSANTTVQKIVDRFQLKANTKLTTTVAKIAGFAKIQDAKIDQAHSLTPAEHALELVIYFMIVLTGVVGLSVLVNSKRNEPTLVLVSAPMAALKKVDDPNMISGEKADSGLKTLATLTKPSSRSSAHLVLVDAAGKSANGVQDSIAEPQLEISADLRKIIHDHRNSGFNHAYTILISEALPTTDKGRVTVKYTSVTGAVTVTKFALEMASECAISTLLIDLGSTHWSQQSRTIQRSDVINIPEGPGVYDILSGNGMIEEFVLLDRSANSLSALGPGNVPKNWEELLQSDSIATLLKNAKSLADLVILYAPRCVDYPATVASLSKFVDSTVLITGSANDSNERELQSAYLLRRASCTILGRIVTEPEADNLGSAGSYMNSGGMKKAS